MKHLKTFQLFETKLIKGDIKNFLNKIYLFEISDSIYAVEIKDVQSRAFVFMRFQEYYESHSDYFRNTDFEIEDYMKWYQNDFKKSDIFTYGKDWSGYNIPSNILEKCISGVKHPNNYDKIMFSIVDTIRKQHQGKFYLIGTGILDKSTIDHELAHAMFYLNPDYKKEMLSLIQQIPKEYYDRMSDELKSFGYTEGVIDDEIQAYISTEFNTSRLNIPEDIIYESNLIFDKYSEDIKNKDDYFIKIDWSKYF